MKLACPNCGDNLSYRVKEKDAFCSTCGSSFSINSLKCDTYDMVTRKCSSCGAEIVTDYETRVITCEYCGGKEFRTVNFENGFKPIGIIPFKITEEEAINVFHLAMKSAKIMQDDFGEILEIQRFYVPYSYEYQFFDNKYDAFKNNIGIIGANDEKNIGDYKQEKLIYGKIDKSLWSYFDYSKMLFQILPYSFKKAKAINPIYLDYAYAMNVKEKYVKDLLGERKPNYYWVPVYKIVFKAPHSSETIYTPNMKDTYIMLINGETKEYATNYEHIHNVNKKVNDEVPEGAFSWKKTLLISGILFFFPFIFTLWTAFAMIIAVTCIEKFSNDKIGIFVILGMYGIFVALFLKLLKKK